MKGYGTIHYIVKNMNFKHFSFKYNYQRDILLNTSNIICNINLDESCQLKVILKMARNKENVLHFRQNIAENWHFCE